MAHLSIDVDPNLPNLRRPRTDLLGLLVRPAPATVARDRGARGRHHVPGSLDGCYWAYTRLHNVIHYITLCYSML